MNFNYNKLAGVLIIAAAIIALFYLLLFTKLSDAATATYAGILIALIGAGVSVYKTK